eukprot:TRINITY_DN1934_c0_g1_i1.p1 TRINITY_DN1934_c0_g1~~TRINITY_DN1934_c0_g1_i1.p1  ORF type:complete len:361 (-),score=51.83 TRINITY_DN1934_c0_g1_i1:360-1442(-)
MFCFVFFFFFFFKSFKINMYSNEHSIRKLDELLLVINSIRQKMVLNVKNIPLLNNISPDKRENLKKKIGENFDMVKKNIGYLMREEEFVKSFIVKDKNRMIIDKTKKEGDNKIVTCFSNTTPKSNTIELEKSQLTLLYQLYEREEWINSINKTAKKSLKLFENKYNERFPSLQSDLQRDRQSFYHSKKRKITNSKTQNILQIGSSLTPYTNLSSTPSPFFTSTPGFRANLTPLMSAKTPGGTFVIPSSFDQDFDGSSQIILCETKNNLDVIIISLKEKTKLSIKKLYKNENVEQFVIGLNVKCNGVFQADIFFSSFIFENSQQNQFENIVISNITVYPFNQPSVYISYLFILYYILLLDL